MTPGRMSYRQAADRLGYPLRCLHGQFIRQGFLPWPCSKTLTWAAADIEALRAWLLSPRDGSMPQPKHINY